MAGVPQNKALYTKVKSQAKRKFNVYPSAYANSWVVRRYKELGGKYKGSKGKSSLKKGLKSVKRKERSRKRSARH